MTPTTIALLTALIAVDTGWQPLEEGGLEYIIQIEPELIDSLKAGRELKASLLPDLKEVTRVRIVIGNSDLPRNGELIKSLKVPTDDLITEQKNLPDPKLLHSEVDKQKPNPAEMAAVAERPENLVETSFKTDAKEAGILPQTNEVKSTPENSTGWSIITLLGLFASLGGNAFLGMVVWGQRRQFTKLANRAQNGAFTRESTIASSGIASSPSHSVSSTVSTLNSDKSTESTPIDSNDEESSSVIEFDQN